MVDPIRYYDLERYLFEDVGRHFAADQSIGAFDFFSIVIWKANRAKSYIARRLLRRDKNGRAELEPIVRDLTASLFDAPDEKARLGILVQEWGFGLPMASAILSVLWPLDFTVYDVRVCEQLGRFAKLGSLSKFEAIWEGYSDYRDSVRLAVPGDLSLREKDRHLWATSMVKQLERDIAAGFRIEAGT